MPTLDNDTLIKQYFHSIREQYPDLSLRDVEQICKAPFWYIKAQMEQPTMPNIRIQYFGKFEVFPGKLKAMLRKIESKFKVGVITEKIYEEKKRIYTTILNKVEDDNKEQIIEIIDDE